ncbi:MAG: NYN domain-containing protein [Spirochaetales bacterium]|nr:NYN domain-containing protein [Spirochaetales bacterium]
MKQTAILWDVENVTPSDSYVHSIVEWIAKDCKVSYALAFADWNKGNIKNIAGEIAAHSFELVHIPQSKKNSADISLITRGVELIFQYPHIERFILITGDSDFRPLLTSFKKYGKETWIICDVKNNASEDLLKMADQYFDYRRIIEADSDDDEKDEDSDSKDFLSRPQAYELFQEAVVLMLKEKKKPSLGSVKIKMKLLNDAFDEKKLDYRSWRAFVNDAIAHSEVDYADENKNILIARQNIAQEIPQVFQKLLEILKREKDWVHFTDIAKKVPYKELGYSKFKKLALDAEKRGYVVLQNKGRVWSVKTAK